jgi:hypothetical protein
MRDGHVAALGDISTFGYSPAAIQMPAGRTIDEYALDDLASGVYL